MSGDLGKVLAGQVLISHPALRHDAFKRTVVLLTAHSDTGTLGFILNRPLTKPLGAVAPGFAGTALGAAPLYEGGPVSANRFSFCTFHWQQPEGEFRIKFGISREEAESFFDKAEDGARLLCLAGYAGWAPGQLKDELRHNAWVVAPVDHHLLQEWDGEALWRAFLREHHPVLSVLAEAPEAPEMN
ncbi:MAG: YqgE/AlgH family protein [Puniceicoccales bacterium]|jgi:putative transcriptional regulator|nr:YqgE/AlgH family protein [Puniceicoccales bacterium]